LSVVLLVLAASVASACSGSADKSGESAPVGQAAGAPIAGGLVSPEGTVLLGAPFVSRNVGFENPVTLQVDAFMVVTGDPVRALTDLLEQASRAGIDMTSSVGDEDKPEFCWVTDVEYGWPAEHRGELADSLECEAHGISGVAAGTQRTLSIGVLVGGENEPSVSLLTVTYAERSIQASPAPVTASVPLPGGPSPVDPPEFPSSLPEPGQPLGAPFAPEGEDSAILPHSQLLAPPIPQCATGGFVAVLQFDDELDVMFDRYDDEVRQHTFRGVESQPGDAFELEGTQYRYRSYEAAGGGDLTLQATMTAGQPGYILVERCND
jgi:hypothetical protein